ncbi:peptidoglycan hydrolase-like protein with peptidoglycan-binding domain [Luteibacter jiangsuensis]|uniref:Peptidoglycan hydrolase-like protein with peptidoglycan-binding domain n=1 Tax=Luteibacter jiangsuensis TaxID=637577 RepID=A0ABT9T1E4_9GAMM|nr:peptidoglycan-binding domain-containing protein [Luteibacter jiangsuensis]MDQ0010328.1 peptidoglycan hydrolase-like protein with peptidoglycan-binding domain [Luteibacter jiangsuensis]
MDVVSTKNVSRLAATQGTTRIYELEDGTWLKASGGTVAWRNNNPGNLKFEFSGSADTTSRATRTRERALETAKDKFDGVVDLDQWGNAIFESYEAGRKAQQSLLTDRFKDKTVEELVKIYSTADYSGETHHSGQIGTIHTTAEARGLDLRNKIVDDMTSQELDALADGLSKAEGWKPGIVESMPPQTPEQLAERLQRSPAQAAATAPHLPDHPAALRAGARGEAVGDMQNQLRTLGYAGSNGRPLIADNHFGSQTSAAVESFQRTHGLRVDGVVGTRTLDALHTAQRMAADARLSGAPLLDNARHPAHEIYQQARAGVQQLDERHGRVPGPHSENLAGSLTSAAVSTGMHRIDHVALNDDASRAYAIQGEARSPFKLHAEVDVMQAIQTPLARSSAEALLPVERANRSQAIQQTLDLQPSNPQAQPSPPGMRM